MLMAVSGHKTLSEVQRYTADADKQNSPMKRWNGLRTNYLQTRRPKLANRIRSPHKIELALPTGIEPVFQP